MGLALLLARQIFSMMLMLLTGYAVMKAGLLPESAGKAVSALVLYVFCPAIILSAFRMEFSVQKLGSLIVGTIAACTAVSLYLILSRVFQKLLHLDDLDRMSLIYPNSGNLIVPLVAAVLGSEYVFYSSTYLAVMNAMTWIHGEPLISGKKDIKIRKILLNPNMLAIFGGLLLFLTRFPLPELLWGTIGRIGDCIGPASMISIGIFMSDSDLKKVFLNRKAWILAGLRLIVFPFLFILLICLAHPERFFPGAGNVLIATILAAAAPSAVLVPQLAALHGKDASFASAVNILTTLLCILTLPGMFLVYEFMYLAP